MNELLQDAARRGAAFLSALDQQRVAPGPQALAGLQAFDEPLPERGHDPRDTLELLDRAGSPATIASAGPRYFGFVTGGALPATVAAHWLATAWDQNSALSVMSPVAVRLEQVALGWVRELLDLPAGCRGHFVTGTTMGNLVGLAAARHALLTRAGHDIEGRGLYGAPPLHVVVGEQAHAVIYRALGLLGMGRERVVRAPVDGQGRIRVDTLPEMTSTTILCLQAGNVDSGAFDPAELPIEAAHAAGAWVHVDGAFGLWAKAAAATAHLAHGFEAADSWVTDGHKWLNVPYDSGLVFVRDALALAAAMAMSAAYLPPGDAGDALYTTPEGSRRARGIDTWAALRSLGRSGLAKLVERCCAHARHFADGLRSAGFEVLNEVVLNQVMVSFGDDATTQRVVQEVQAEGTCWCGGTTWNGRAGMRISVSGWSTTTEDVDRSVAAIVRCARAVAG